MVIITVYFLSILRERSCPDALQGDACGIGDLVVARGIGGVLQQLGTDNRASVLPLELLKQLLHARIIGFLAIQIARRGRAAPQPLHHTHRADRTAYTAGTTYAPSERSGKAERLILRDVIQVSTRRENRLRAIETRPVQRTRLTDTLLYVLLSKYHYS